MAVRQSPQNGHGYHLESPFSQFRELAMAVEREYAAQQSESSKPRKRDGSLTEFDPDELLKELVKKMQEGGFLLPIGEDVEFQYEEKKRQKERYRSEKKNMRKERYNCSSSTLSNNSFSQSLGCMEDLISISGSAGSKYLRRKSEKIEQKSTSRMVRRSRAQQKKAIVSEATSTIET
eukprot:CAMPEP_0206371928 /NCGR_PEP_ID=MMETSP0294-20121207/6792_1 /ASSEMBLY_ACC=CAM_ASM_000327 /TAXON_ID=39354 /ORGANISM="Heterosigma akashiwo, Strain CCMP2393" /LENGTH=176 /DNA_ID=CAMNT_0053819183 /DNA_START=75 /DNA_END=605 /DNA_ORIENTATION=+